MPGANNFQVFDEDYTNIMSDVDYTASTTRQEGVVSGPAVSILHNKMYRQTSVMVAALAGAMAAKEINMLDSSLANLITSLGNLQIGSEVDAKISNAIVALGISTFIMTSLFPSVDASESLTALGISPFIKTLLDDTTAASAKATLGISAFAQTLLDDTTAASARTTLGLVTNPFGAWGAVGNNTVYYAATDGFVLAYNSAAEVSGYDLRGYSDGGNPPGTVRSICVGYNAYTSTTGYYSIAFPVRKSDYWKVTGCGPVYWLPVGS